MKPDKKILEELKSISPILAELERVNVFAVPDGYFDRFPQSYMVSLGAESENMNSIKFPAHDVPDGYFENLAGNILQKIKEEENPENLFIEGLNKVNPFYIPENYFISFPNNIMASIQNNKAKVVSMPKNNAFIKYAVAAMLTGALALSVYKYSENSNNNITSTTQIASLDPSIEKGKNMDEKQFTLTLNSLSEDEITAYLEKNGDEKDLQMLASVIDEKSLPTQDDYLLDENILEKYLGEDSTTK